jgi:hypothetical protein
LPDLTDKSDDLKNLIKNTVSCILKNFDDIAKNISKLVNNFKNIKTIADNFEEFKNELE